MNRSASIPLPLPLFDTMDHLNDTPKCVKDWLNKANIPEIETQYQCAQKFLSNYAGSPDTYNTYRREVERHLQWAWLLHIKPLHAIESTDIHDYMSFVQQPPKPWISTKNVARFIDSAQGREHNRDWRPFVVRLAKSQHKLGEVPQVHHYRMHHKSLASVLAVLSTFYAFLQQHEITSINPVQMLRQKNRYLQKQQQQHVTRKLTKTQWRYVIESTESLAQNDSNFERHLFIISAFYLLGLRISELAETPGRVPQMGDFYPDHDGRWWFSTVGKGNKQRDVAVPDLMLNALRRYRQTLGLPSLPYREEPTPLIMKQRGYGGLGTRQIRNLVQQCFDHAIDQLKQSGQVNEAQDLAAATVHWLRHTAISADVKLNRPREHVRDDAGHENSVITDRYIDIDRQARHDSAKSKPLIPEE